MKKTQQILLCAIFMLMQATITFAQSSNNQDEVVKIDRWAIQNYRQGEIIVKFKPTAKVKMHKSADAVTSGVSAVDALFEKIGATDVEQLMPNTSKGNRPSLLKSVNGTNVNTEGMNQLYRIKFDESKAESVMKAVEEVEELTEIEYAEPNYILYALSSGSEITDCEHYESEPLFKEQWAFNAINLKNVWTKKKITDKRPVIAILDTGVDTEHPDLAENIWTNEREANGQEDADDDANGFKDDLHGWDFVNQTSRLGDWNGHGTHVAGIAAAAGKNGIGITGANPDALIMPVTVMQSDGTGDVATIIKGIDYAAANGADIINMSIGTYGYSLAMEQALGRAYATAVLVAAAGNDCLPMQGKCPVCTMQGMPMFPAAFTFVLGVESSNRDGSRASFSNYDFDGPTLSTFGEDQLYNYELRAPGVAIMSTFPGGKYKALNGTSMASPLVAGAISRLLQCKEYTSKEVLFGDLIHARKKSSNNIVDFGAAYEITDADRTPELQLVTYAMVDTINGGDGDGTPDAGETIELYPTFRNEWGIASNITFTLEVGEAEDPEIVEILDGTVEFGKPLSSYAKGKSNNPIRFKINDECADGRHIRLLLRATCDNISQPLEEEFVIIAENGIELGGMITEDMTLYPGVKYIVTKNLAVPDNVTLTILPGTIIEFKNFSSLSCSKKSTVVCYGTYENFIIFKDGIEGGGRSIILPPNTILKYVILDGILIESNGNTNSSLEDCVLKNASTSDIYLYNLLRTNIIENEFYSTSSTETRHYYTNYINNYTTSGYSSLFLLSPNYTTICENSNIFGNKGCFGVSGLSAYNSSSVIGIHKMLPNYLGASNKDVVKNWIYDINHPKSSSFTSVMIDYSNMLTRPSAEAHGIVWKVLVNGYDAQDEFEMLPPLGVGKHKFDVYFNRPMDTSVAPSISMGVRSPYTQVSIAEDGAWSADSLVYTAYLTIDGKTNTDGLNRIYVYGARDNEYFDIPEENFRFNVEVQAAGSMATGLMAEAGLGKVKLTWETDEEDFEDLLGYNIYRYTKDTLGVESDSTIVNPTVLEAEEVEFTDYNVTPGTTYYYVIKQLTTSLNSHALSNAVAATPLTAQRGDANGSMSVDIADVVSEVAYITYQDPQPFIFEAADVNSDTKVNVLDVVGTLNIITSPSSISTNSTNNTAIYTIEDGILYVENTTTLGGVQVRLIAEQGSTITPLEGVEGFEQNGTWTAEDEYLFLAYSMVGRTILPGKHALLNIGDAEVEQLVLSDARGINVLPINGNLTGVGTVENMQIQSAFPNPFTTQLTIPYVIGKEGEHNVAIIISDLTGRTVYNYATVQEYGEYSHTWTPSATISNGFYMVSLYVDGKLMQTAKVFKN
ncbi:MAG: S8 family serine peptidase [Bacteroidales bacterium]|nr:S8 family serine peptidase [Bacteroidales bacterium]